VGKSDLTRSNLIWFSDFTGKARELILLRLHVAEVERKLFSVRVFPGLVFFKHTWHIMALYEDFYPMMLVKPYGIAELCD
jgi:hypothetical protein